MDINFEILVIVAISIIFAILYLMSEDFETRMLTATISIICWFALGLTWIASTPTFTGLSYLFFGIGLVFVFFTFNDAYELTKKKGQSLEP